MSKRMMVQTAAASGVDDMIHCVLTFDGCGRIAARNWYVQTYADSRCLRATPGNVRDTFGGRRMRVKYSSLHTGSPESFRASMEKSAVRSWRNFKALERASGCIAVKRVSGGECFVLDPAAVGFLSFPNKDVFAHFGAEGLWTGTELLNLNFKLVSFEESAPDMAERLERWGGAAGAMIGSALMYGYHTAQWI